MKALEAKIVVLGSQGVGKTSLIDQYISKLSPKEIAPTIGASFFICKIIIEDVKIKMQVWDTAGQERFRAMAPMYYRNANAALLVFDISNYNSFIEVKKWAQELQKNVQESIIITLIGNKNDLEQKRCVSREESFLYASAIGANYLETSSVSNQGIEQVFLTTALGLIRLSESRTCGSSLRKYESMESVSTFCSSIDNLLENRQPVHLSEAIDAANFEATATGRLEVPSWSINHIAHGYVHKTGWCCN